MRVFTSRLPVLVLALAASAPAFGGVSLTSVTPNNGRSTGGTRIVVVGSGFGVAGANSAVTFGSFLEVAAGAVVSWSDGQIELDTPDGEAAGLIGIVPLNVRNNSSQVAPTALTFDFVQAPIIDSISPSSQRADLTVTILGFYFRNDPTNGPPKVYFGGLESPQVTYNYSFELLAKVPTGPDGGTIVNVTVENQDYDRQSVTLGSAFTYKLGPLLLLTASPDHGYFAGGAAVTLTAQNLYPDNVEGHQVWVSLVFNDGTQDVTLPAVVTNVTVTPVHDADTVTFTVPQAPEYAVEEYARVQVETGTPPSSKSSTSLFYYVDAPPVTPVIVSPQVGAHVDGTVWLVATAGDDRGLSEVLFQYRPAAGAWTDIVSADPSNYPNPLVDPYSAPYVPSGYSVPWDVSGLPAGNCDVRVVATDDHVASAYNLNGVQTTNGSAMSITIDHLTPDNPPEVHITEPANGAVVFSPDGGDPAEWFTISADVTDDVGLASSSPVRFLVDGNQITGTITILGDTYSIQWNTYAFTDGKHVVGVQAWDSADQVGHAYVTVTVANRVDTDQDLLTDEYEKQPRNGSLGLDDSGQYPGTDYLDDDSDDDGLTDGYEWITYPTISGGRRLDPMDADTDGDGLPDGWEVRYFTSPTNVGTGWVQYSALDPLDDGTANVLNGPDGDPDGDGHSNLDEYTNNTDPTDPTSYYLKPKKGVCGIAPGAADPVLTWLLAAAGLMFLLGATRKETA